MCTVPLGCHEVRVYGILYYLLFLFILQVLRIILESIVKGKVSGRKPHKVDKLKLPPCAVRKVIREAKENRQGLLLVNWKKSKTFTKSLKPPSDAAPMPTAYLKGWPENTFICLLSSTIKCLTPETSQMAGTLFYGLIKQKLSSLAINTEGGFGVKRRMPIMKSTLF